MKGLLTILFLIILSVSTSLSYESSAHRFRSDDPKVIVDGFVFIVDYENVIKNIDTTCTYFSVDHPVYWSFDQLPLQSQKARMIYDDLQEEYAKTSRKCSRKKNFIQRWLKPHRVKKSCLKARNIRGELDSLKDFFKAEPFTFAYIDTSSQKRPTASHFKRAKDYILNIENEVEGSLIIDSLLSSSSVIIFNYHRNEQFLGHVPVLFTNQEQPTADISIDTALSEPYRDKLLHFNDYKYNPLVPGIQTLAKVAKMTPMWFANLKDPARATFYYSDRADEYGGLVARLDYGNNFIFLYLKRTSSIRFTSRSIKH